MLLLAHGADSNICGMDSLAPLHIATRRGDAESVNTLLNANTSTTIRTKDGQTALDIARAKGYESIYARLMEKRNGVARQPAAVVAATPNSLINNVRNELPSILQSNRPDSLSANAGSIAPASRKLQTLGRLIQQSKIDHTSDDVDDTSGAGVSSSVNRNSSGSTSAARRRRHTPTATSSSIDSTGSGDRNGAWAGGEAGSKESTDDNYALLGRFNSEDAKAERQQKVSSSSPSKGNANSGAGLVSTSQKAGGNNTTTPSSSSSYSIIGAGAPNNSVPVKGGMTVAGTEDPGTTALRKILDQEKSARKQLEMKVFFYVSSRFLKALYQNY